MRIVRRELEARLTPPDGELSSGDTPPLRQINEQAIGKLERKSYRDGLERLKITIRRLQVPDGSFALVRVGAVEVAQLEMLGGAGRLDHRTRDPGAMSSLDVGQRVEVFVDDVLMLRGDLQLD